MSLWDHSRNSGAGAAQPAWCCCCGGRLPALASPLLKLLEVLPRQRFLQLAPVNPVRCRSKVWRVTRASACLPYILYE